MSSQHNQAVSVRSGEGMDLPRLTAYLDEHLPGRGGEIEVRQFPAGFSNLTYLIIRGGDEWVLRRPPFGTRPRSGHDMAREYRVLAALQDRFPYCPQPILLCEDESVLGAPFYLAQRLRGLILRRDYPAGLAATPALVRAQQEALVRVHAELHAVDYQAAGLAELGRPEGYAARQLQGWTERYASARTPDAPAASVVTDWLAAELPAELPCAALIHNDFKLDNVVFDAADPTRLIGVLDWEMATLGDPRMDLGCSLAYWVEATDPAPLLAARMLPTHLPGSLKRNEVVALYAAASGIAVGDMEYFRAFGLFRLAVIAQQIYYRYYHGQTRDPRFAALGPMTHALVGAAEGIARV